MKISAIVVLCSISVLEPASIARVEDPSNSKPTALFDGKSLDGWKKTDFHRAGDVKLEAGSIQLVRGDGMTGITSTRKDLPKVDYELSYEAMRTEGDDFFAAATFPVKDSHLTFVNGGWGGSITGLSSLDGADASENETSVGFTYEKKKWYRFRIRVTADAVRCWIDDKAMAEVDISDRTVGTRLEVRENQPLGFATWETGGALRKIEIRKLTPAEIAANRVAEKE
jgi:hypothetical protein